MKDKIQIGDIFEIKTKFGLSYAQLTHKHPTHSELLRIFKTFYATRPLDYMKVVQDAVLYTVLFPLVASFKSKLIERVGTAPVRNDLKTFPVFRDGIPDRDTKIVKTWWLWDGETETKIGPHLTEEQQTYPRLGILNLPAVVGLIEGNTHPSLL